MNCTNHRNNAGPDREGPPLDLAQIRERLSEDSGRGYWRSLEELADSEPFQEFLHREFPSQASEWQDGFSRRHFLKLMGASLALAGVGACTRQPVEKIVPYVKQPPELTPGKPLFFATAMTLGGFATGVIATSHEGRPTKIEGNAEHPASLGATSIFAQAGVLDLYDPDRARSILNAGKPADWTAFLAAIASEMDAQKKKQGAGLRILTGTVTSPTLYSQLQSLLVAYPLAKWHQWDPLTRDNVREGARLAFGMPVETQYHFEKARVILALDADFLSMHPAALRHARQFAESRRVEQTPHEGMSRLYAVEPTPTITGAMADHRLPLAAAEVGNFTATLAGQLGIAGYAGSPAAYDHWLEAVARDLQKNSGHCIVIAGNQQPAEVHAIVHAINRALGSQGKTITYTKAIEPSPVNQLASFKELAAEMKAGTVDMLVMAGGNPVFDAPADLEFAAVLQNLKMCIRIGTHEDETSRYCHWHIPEAHYLESWSDARAFDGTASIIQPLIEPLYDGRTVHELIDALLQGNRGSYDIVREYWKSQNILPNFEKAWAKSLSDGLIAGTQAAFISPAPLPPAIPKPAAQNKGLEIVFRPDPTILDGSFSNNGWLQELPKPITKLTWDNPALISPALAEREGLQNGNMVELQFQGRTLQIPVWIVPGQAASTVVLHLGYGREHAGAVGTGTGFNTYTLRASDALWSGTGLEIRKLDGKNHFLATTQKHFNVEGRDIIREGTVEKFKANPRFLEAGKEPRPGKEDTLYNPDEFKYEGYKWSMSIDLNTCIGCNACVIACQAENNISVVGKEQVGRGREMHWIRVDTYFKGGLENPGITHQPVPCMHCENAPCELVCPVGATVHDSEGLNVQVYNRCIGTRYCSNNCPYKVRRFNFLEFNAGMSPVQKMVKNPDVTVRSRGVMEKCTYCTQRINAARITAELEGRKIRDGDILTACQAACPAAAIIFGDLNDPGSKVAKRKAQPLDYWMLGELNTRPRTSYLARLRNPNPEIGS